MVKKIRTKRLYKNGETVWVEVYCPTGGADWSTELRLGVIYSGPAIVTSRYISYIGSRYNYGYDYNVRLPDGCYKGVIDVFNDGKEEPIIPVRLSEMRKL